MDKPMNGADQTRQKLEEILREIGGHDNDFQILDHHAIADDLGIDSLSQVDVVMEVEQAFSIEIDDETLAEMKTVGQLLEVICQRATATRAA